MQPDARFWLCTAPPVNPDMIGEQELPVFTVANCRAINALIRELAEERGFGVIDVYSLFADEEGVLPPESTGDGIHLTIECYRRWGRYLASAVVPEGEAEATAGEEPPTEEEPPSEEEPPEEEPPASEEEDP